MIEYRQWGVKDEYLTWMRLNWRAAEYLWGKQKLVNNEEKIQKEGKKNGNIDGLGVWYIWQKYLHIYNLTVNLWETEPFE